MSKIRRSLVAGLTGLFLLLGVAVAAPALACHTGCSSAVTNVRSDGGRITADYTRDGGNGFASIYPNQTLWADYISWHVGPHSYCIWKIGINGSDRKTTNTTGTRIYVNSSGLHVYVKKCGPAA